MKNNKLRNKLLLVTSSFEDVPEVPISITNDDSHYPIGMGYLYSYIESKGVDVELLSLNHFDYETCYKKVMDKIKEFSPDFVGLQLLSSNRVSSYRLIELIHKEYPEIQLILGGIHTTIMYEQLIDKYPFVIAVLGEGEITLDELLHELNKEQPNLRSIDGIAFYNQDLYKVERTKPRELVTDLDIFPFPKHELFFKDSNRFSGCIITSRGCFMKCSFCVLNPESKRIVRYRTPKNVVDEIEHMANSFPQMTEIFIHDDSFFADNKRVIEICDEIIKRKIKLEFVCSGRMRPLTEEMIKKLEEVNFTRVILGIESGDNSILKSCHKGITQSDIERGFKLFAKSKINLKTFLIVGLPGENIDTINETARFIKKMQKIKYVSYGDFSNFLMVYPGTEVYEIAKSKGMMTDDFWMGDEEIPVYIAENSIEELKRLGGVLSDNISYERILTWKGFKAQFKLIPTLMVYFGKRIIARVRR